MFKRILIFSFVVLLSQSCFSQYKKRINESGFSLMTGLSIVDDNFTTDFNPFGFSRFNYGFYVGAELKVFKNLSAQLVFSRNFYREGNFVDGRPLERDLKYEALDLYGLYSLTEAFNLRKYVEPYIIGGFGTTIIDNDNRITLNLGVGFRIWMREWFTRRQSIFMQGLGFTAQTQIRYGLGTNIEGNNYGSHLMHTAGIIYQF